MALINEEYFALTEIEKIQCCEYLLQFDYHNKVQWQTCWHQAIFEYHRELCTRRGKALCLTKNVWQQEVGKNGTGLQFIWCQLSIPKILWASSYICHYSTSVFSNLSRLKEFLNHRDILSHVVCVRATLQSALTKYTARSKRKMRATLEERSNKTYSILSQEKYHNSKISTIQTNLTTNQHIPMHTQRQVQRQRKRQIHLLCIQFSHNYRQRQQRLLLQCSAYFCLHGKGFSDICRYSTSVSTNLNRLKPSLWRRFPFPCCTRLQEKVRRSISRVTSALTEDKMTNCIPLATTNTTPRYVPSFENCRTIGLWNKSSKSRAVTSQLYPA